jgi:hypothetical protein
LQDLVAIVELEKHGMLHSSFTAHSICLMEDNEKKKEACLKDFEYNELYTNMADHYLCAVDSERTPSLHIYTHLYLLQLSRLRPIFCFSLSFSCQRLLPQRHTHSCHMEAMLKPCNCLAAPTASVLQAGSLGIWLPAPFGCLFTRKHLSHQSHVTRWSVRSVFSINSGPCRFS